MNNGTRSAAASALRDQADAAGAEAARVMAALAELMGGTLDVQLPTGPTAKIMRRLGDRALRGDLSLCEHLTGGPRPAVWLAWRASKLRCFECAARVSRAIQGSPEDSRCDSCRKTAAKGRIFSGATLFPPMVVDLPGLLAGAGPILVTYGLCGRCHWAAGLDVRPG